MFFEAISFLHAKGLLLVRQKPGDKELPLGTGETCESLLNQGPLLVVGNVALVHFAVVEIHFLILTSEKIEMGNTPPHEAGRVGVIDGSEKKFGKH